jgi:hypothetical protein
MASTIGSTIASFGAPFIPDLADAANVQTALKLLYYGTGGTLNNSNGIHGALYTLYTGDPSLAGSTIFTKTNAVTLAGAVHAVQIGATASTNIAMSPAIIQARNNGAASGLSINSLGGNVTLGDASSTVTVVGNLTVSGTTTTLDVANLLVEDKEIVIGNVASPTNATADGGGIRLEAGAGVDKTILWDTTNSNWTTSEHWNLANSKTLKIDNVAIASGTGGALVLGGNATTSTSVGNTSGTVVLNSGTVLGTQATQNLFNTVATTLNIGGAANVAVNVGANGGTASILNPTVTLTNATVLNLNGATQSIVGGTIAGTASVFNTNTGTVNVGGAATTLVLGGTTGTGSIRNATVTFPNATAMTLGAASPTITFGTGPTLTTASGTVTLFNTGTPTVNAFGASTAIAIGGSSSTTTIAGNLTMSTQGKQLLLANGNNTTAPLKFSGTTVTNYLNASAGTMEYNGKAFIATPNAFSGQGFVATPYHTMLEGDVYITQSGGNTTAFGAAITLGPGYYEFELQIPFQFTYVTSATALSLGIKGTAVADGVYFLQEHFSNTGALTNLLLAAAVTNTVSSGRVQTNWRQNQASQSLNTSNLVSEMDSLTSGSRYGVYRARGWVNITTQGTFFPAASITGGGNGYIKAGAYAKITPLPSSASGYWSSQT